MKKILMCLLCLFLTQNANAFCRTIKPRFSVRTNTGTVRYQTHLSRDEFLKKAPTKMSPNTLGMTVSKLKITGNAEPDIQTGAGQICVQVKKFNLVLGYDIIDVYIDKKYKPGTCEYEVVKEHENYHVRVSQEAMLFFKPNIDEALKKAVSKLKPVYVHSQADAQRAFENQFKQVVQDIQPLLDHINKKIAEKNYIIDTPESYMETTKLFKNW